MHPPRHVGRRAPAAGPATAAGIPDGPPRQYDHRPGGGEPPSPGAAGECPGDTHRQHRCAAPAGEEAGAGLEGPDCPVAAAGALREDDDRRPAGELLQAEAQGGPVVSVPVDQDGIQKQEPQPLQQRVIAEVVAGAEEVDPVYRVEGQRAHDRRGVEVAGVIGHDNMPAPVAHPVPRAARCRVKEAQVAAQQQVERRPEGAGQQVVAHRLHGQCPWPAERPRRRARVVRLMSHSKGAR